MADRHGKDITIRPATMADASEMARLSAELGYPMPCKELERRLAGLLSSPRHHVMAAVQPGETKRLWGWAHVEHRVSIEGGQRAELMGLIVDSMARRTGIGQRLVEEAEKWAVARGLSALTIRSNAARDSSHPFYEALGYARIKTQHVYTKAVGTGEAS